MAKSKYVHLRAPLSRAPTSGQRRYFTVCGIDLTVHMLHRYEKAKNVRLVDCPHCQETSYYMIAARRANLIVAAEHMFVGMALAQLGQLGMTERDVLFVQSSRLKIQGTWEDWATFARTYEPPVDTTIVGDGWWMVLQTHVGGVHWLYLTSPMRFVTHEDLDAEAKEVVAHDDEVQRVRRAAQECCGSVERRHDRQEKVAAGGGHEFGFHQNRRHAAARC
jgi:hypothetical protein